jgi:hypothetical protein
MNSLSSTTHIYCCGSVFTNHGVFYCAHSRKQAVFSAGIQQAARRQPISLATYFCLSMPDGLLHLWISSLCKRLNLETYMSLAVY